MSKEYTVRTSAGKDALGPIYVDETGCWIRVHAETEEWSNRAGTNGLYVDEIQKLPWRKTRDEAVQDLVAFAKKHNLKECQG